MLRERLVALRAMHKLTQEQLAFELGITRGALSLYELGKREPDYSILVKIADHFNVSVDYMLGRTDIWTPPADMEIDVAYIDVVKEWIEEGKSPEQIRQMWEQIKTIVENYQNPSGN